MTDWDRLMEYIHDYFPEPIYSSEEVREWAQENVPAWKYMKKKLQDEIIADWEEFVAPPEDIFKEKPSIMRRLRSFLGRLIGRG